MEFLGGGLRALERNWQIVVAFAAVNAALSLATGAWDYSTANELIGPVPEMAERVIRFVRPLAVGAIIALLHAIAFAYMGKDIDRPLWKLNGPDDALNRFFLPWFILILMTLLPWRLFEFFGLEQSGATVLSFVFLMAVLEAFVIPVGACIMFAGRLDWQHIGAHLLPIIDELPRVAVLLFIGFIAYLFIFFSSVLAVPREGAGLDWLYKLPAIAVLGSIVSLLIFAAMWEILRIHRDTADHNDLDF